jgi:hypothetical protein
MLHARGMTQQATIVAQHAQAAQVEVNAANARRDKNVSFTVIGLLSKKGQSMLGQDRDDIVMVLLSTARNRLFGNAQGKA